MNTYKITSLIGNTIAHNIVKAESAKVNDNGDLQFFNNGELCRSIAKNCWHGVDWEDDNNPGNIHKFLDHIRRQVEKENIAAEAAEYKQRRGWQRAVKARVK